MTARLRLLPVALTGGAVLVLLLVPRHVDLHIAWLGRSGLLGHAVDGGTPLWWLLEDVSNVLMFMPVGVVLARLMRPVVATVVGTGLSGACELAQHWIPNRDGSLVDLAMNAIGTGLGVVVVLLLRRRQARRAWPHTAHDQYGSSSVPAASIAVRQRTQFGTSSDTSSSALVPTGSW